MYQVVSSAEAGIVLKNRKKWGTTKVLPFEQTKVGQSFFVPSTDISSATVKVLASRRSCDGKRYSTTKAKDGIWVNRVE